MKYETGKPISRHSAVAMTAIFNVDQKTLKLSPVIDSAGSPTRACRDRRARASK